jgi:fructokinase
MVRPIYWLKRAFPAGLLQKTLVQAARFFRHQSARFGALAALGIGSFGPLDLDPRSPTYGFITTTLKPGWIGTDLAGYFRRSLGVPVRLDTDVNAALLGEASWGAGRGCRDLLYLTVGTDRWRPGQRPAYPRLAAPRDGSYPGAHDLQRDPFPGVCASHGDCLEGLASARL